MTKAIFITGPAGTGKSSLCMELIKRGKKAIDIEEVEGLCAMLDKRTGKPFIDYDNNDLEKVRHLDWICDKDKLQKIIQENNSGIVYYCGSASNFDEILPFFDKVIQLRASPETTRKRLTERKNNDYGRTAEVQEWIISNNNYYDKCMKEKGAIFIDADRSLAEVADEIIKIID